MVSGSSGLLKGKVVAVTRPAHQVDSLVEKIEALGGRALVAPAIRLREQFNTPELQAALTALSSFDWVIFTSVNGVEAFLRAMGMEQIARSSLSERRIATIGPATAARLEVFGLKAQAIPEEYIAEALPDVLGDVEKLSILLPRADIARKTLPKELRSRGATVSEVDIYRVESNTDPELVKRLRDIPAEQVPDYLTFTSSSTVRGFHALLKDAGREEWFFQIPIVSIGPITDKTVQELGACSRLVAKQYTTDGLIQAIVEDQQRAT